MSNDQLLNQLTQQAVEARRMVLGQRLTQQFRGAIADGLFKGLRSTSACNWAIAPSTSPAANSGCTDVIGSGVAQAVSSSPAHSIKKGRTVMVMAAQ
jgi:hypothetical protein